MPSFLSCHRTSSTIIYREGGRQRDGGRGGVRGEGGKEGEKEGGKEGEE